MRPHGFLVSLGFVFRAGLRRPGAGGDWTVDVRGFSFTPTVRQVQVSDK